MCAHCEDGNSLPHLHRCRKRHALWNSSVFEIKYRSLLSFITTDLFEKITCIFLLRFFLRKPLIISSLKLNNTKPTIQLTKPGQFPTKRHMDYIAALPKPGGKRLSSKI